MGDRDRMGALIFEYLKDADGDVLATRENVEIYLALFDRYVTDGDGVVLVAVRPYGLPIAFTMAGEIPLGFETKHGRTAMGWGTYVQPTARRRGLASNLRMALDERLREMGFDSVIGGFRPGSVAAEESLRGTGFEIYQSLGAKRLGKVE